MLHRGFAGSSLLRTAGVALLALLAATAARAETCALKEDDRGWVEHTLDLWQAVSRDYLRLTPAPLPWLVLFDDACVWHVNPDTSITVPGPPADSPEVRLSVAQQSLGVRGFTHGGEVRLPNNETIRARPRPVGIFYFDLQKRRKTFLRFLDARGLAAGAPP